MISKLDILYKDDLYLDLYLPESEELELFVHFHCGDPVLLNYLLGTPEHDPLNRAASHIDGAMSILTGIAANKSIASGMPVNIKDLVSF